MLTVNPLQKTGRRLLFGCTSSSISCGIFDDKELIDYITIQRSESDTGTRAYDTTKHFISDIEHSLEMLGDRHNNDLPLNASVVMETYDSRTIVTEYTIVRDTPDERISENEEQEIMTTLSAQLKNTLSHMGYIDSTLIGALILEIQVDDEVVAHIRGKTGEHIHFQIASSVQSVSGFRARSRIFRKALGYQPLFIHPSLTMLRGYDARERATSEILFGDSVVYFLTHSQGYCPRVDQLPLGKSAHRTSTEMGAFLGEAFDVHAEGLASDCLVTRVYLSGGDAKTYLNALKPFARHLHPNVYVDEVHAENPSKILMECAAEAHAHDIGHDKVGNMYSLSFFTHG